MFVIYFNPVWVQKTNLLQWAPPHRVMKRFLRAEKHFCYVRKYLILCLVIVVIVISLWLSSTSPLIAHYPATCSHRSAFYVCPRPHHFCAILRMPKIILSLSGATRLKDKFAWSWLVLTPKRLSRADSCKISLLCHLLSMVIGVKTSQVFYFTEFLSFERHLIRGHRP